MRKRKKTKFKKILIILFIIVAIISGLLLLQQFVFKNQSIDVKWGKDYYTYLSEKLNDDELDSAKLKEEYSDLKIAFYELEDFENPVMAIFYKENDTDYINIYYIKDSNIEVLQYEGQNIKLFYNIESNGYIYYLINEDKESETKTYIALNNKITSTEPDYYEFSESDYTVAISDDDETITVTDFERKLIDTNTETKLANLKLKDDNIETSIIRALSNYQELGDIINDNLNQDIESILKDINDRVEELESLITLTSENFDDKLANHLKIFVASYGSWKYYNLSNYYGMSEGTYESSACNEGEEAHKIYNINSIEAMQKDLSNYLSEDIISEIFEDIKNDYLYLTEYKNNLYLCALATGMGSNYLDIETAKLEDYSDGSATITINYYSETFEGEKTKLGEYSLYVEYQKTLGKYMIISYDYS